MQDLQGRGAFVTGAASGIGLGMVRAFVNNGMRVVMADIEEDLLHRAAAELATNAVVPVTVDVSSRESVQQAGQFALEQLGRVHVVANNAGVSAGGLMDELQHNDWLWTIGVNYLGVVYGCEFFAAHFKDHGEGGHFVNTSSVAGLVARRAGWGPYNSTKYAVVGLTEVLREEGRLGGFSASVLCPGAVNTNIMAADRNRPQRYGPQVSKVAFDDISDGLRQGLAPEVVGELVVEAIRADRLHIFTDPRAAQLVRKRFAVIDDDFAWAAASAVLNPDADPSDQGTT